MLKRLTMVSGHRCSMQYHNTKRETIYVLKGLLRIEQGINADSIVTVEYGPDESLTLPAGVVHRMSAVEDSIYLEASTPELDDVVRISDDYDRTTE